MCASVCFWCRDPPFDNWQKKADHQKCSFLFFDQIRPTPTAAADNPLNIYQLTFHLRVAAANLSIIIIGSSWQNSIILIIMNIITATFLTSTKCLKNTDYLLAPTGALIVIVVYYTTTSAATF